MQRMSRMMVGAVAVCVIVGKSAFAEEQEPVLNVQPPVAAPILDAGTVPATNAVPDVVTTNVAPVVTEPVVTNAPVVTAPIVPVVTNVPPTVGETPEPTRAQLWSAASWQIGTRYTEIQLQDNRRGEPSNGSYFGTITGITEEQDGFPNKAYVQYRLFKSPVWLGVSYDHVVARTMDDSDGDGQPDMGGSDGNEELQGVIPYLQAAWDNKTRLTPYVQAGLGFYQAKFVPNSWGANGRRYVEASGNVMGIELAGGLSVRLYKNLSADLFAKYMDIDDITGDWFYNYGRNYGGPFVMTMSYVAYGAGLSCRF